MTNQTFVNIVDGYEVRHKKNAYIPQLVKNAGVCIMNLDSFYLLYIINAIVVIEWFSVPDHY